MGGGIGGGEVQELVPNFLCIKFRHSNFRTFLTPPSPPTDMSACVVLRSKVTCFVASSVTYSRFLSLALGLCSSASLSESHQPSFSLALPAPIDQARVVRYETQARQCWCTFEQFASVVY